MCHDISGSLETMLVGEEQGFRDSRHQQIFVQSSKQPSKGSPALHRILIITSRREGFSNDKSRC